MNWRVIISQVLWVLLLVLPSLASEPGLRVVVDCADLSEEGAAAIEARQFGEIMTRGVTSGTLRLGCDSTQVTAVWQGAAGDPPLRRALSRDAGDDPSEALYWLASFLLDSVFKGLEAQGEVSDPPLAVTSAAAVGGGAVSRPVQEPPPEPEETSEFQGERVEEAAAFELSELSTSPDEQMRADEKALAFNFDVAFRSHFFGGKLVGTVGPLFAGGVSLGPWGLRASFTPQFSVSNVEGLSVRDLNFELAPTYQFNSALSLMVGPVLSSLKAVGPSELESTDTRSTRFGIFSLAIFTFEGPRFSPFFSGGLRWLGAERRVTLDEEELIRVSAFQGMLSFGTRFH